MKYLSDWELSPQEFDKQVDRETGTGIVTHYGRCQS